MTLKDDREKMFLTSVGKSQTNINEICLSIKSINNAYNFSALSINKQLQENYIESKMCQRSFKLTKTFLLENRQDRNKNVTRYLKMLHFHFHFEIKKSLLGISWSYCTITKKSTCKGEVMQ